MRAGSALEIPRIESGHLRTDFDLAPLELMQALGLAVTVKDRPGEYADALRGRSLVWLTEKDSLRTSVTFQLAMRQLGGDCVTHVCRLGEREAVQDVASNLGQWVQVIAARTYRQSTIDALAEHAGVPVINALSDLYHPCQALGDMLTLQELWGSLRGKTLAFVGDGNNVCCSLMINAVRLGMNFRFGGPVEYWPKASLVSKLNESSEGFIKVFDFPEDAVTGADAVYTDTWVSMGQEHDAEQRMSDLSRCRVTEDLFGKANTDAVFMHCLPAHRGQEVVSSVIDSSMSLVNHQAANRLYIQKALLLMLLAGQ